MPSFIDLTGQKFGRFAVLSRASSNMRGKVAWNVICECSPDITRIVTGETIKYGNATSCGCRAIEGLRERSTGSNHYGWKGGVHIRKDGYRHLALSVARQRYPDAVPSARHLLRGMSEHTAAMSHHLKRALIIGETVHHKDGDRLNNDINNLELWVKRQPAGQRVEDIVSWAEEMLRRYKPEALV